MPGRERIAPAAERDAPLAPSRTTDLPSASASNPSMARAELERVQQRDGAIERRLRRGAAGGREVHGAEPLGGIAVRRVSCAARVAADNARTTIGPIMRNLLTSGLLSMIRRTWRPRIYNPAHATTSDSGDLARLRDPRHARADESDESFRAAGVQILHGRRSDDRRHADGAGAGARHVAGARAAVPDAHRDRTRISCTPRSP